mmetsp:Transcript_6292/g.15591  ORF Transcript_6292/g.15591 Transcript_6292/m.15591 type:complete len:387 (+) Transcript_6292:59-1219(+)|eukprot:CAMPEP_0197183128 /NCGR_PEP_ID=MMETSP1423-20130617/7494_1 /TAXON_ID=476441 /ORGANISM="Pseudo-nitzschia heimii, Strain UNC1101" /LENGTH=386 /DNA_ID=CAMNT_0042633675 /DNA_START=26 /DNA_END=1186 /DNA_ORIENTATION=+
MNGQNCSDEDNGKKEKLDEREEQLELASKASGTSETIETKTQGKGETAQLNARISSNETGRSSQSKMVGTKKIRISTETAGDEQENRGRSKVIFDVPISTRVHERQQLPSKLEDTENIANRPLSKLQDSHVGRVCEASIASDVSGLTDGEFLKMDDLSVSSVTATNTASNKFVGTPVRAPEPPVLSPDIAKLNDIQSETTDTTVSSSKEETLPKGKKRRSVSFSEVQIRNYERVVEVNPSVTSGPAIGIGWHYSADEDKVYPVDNFENSRQFERCHNTMELALPRDKREDLLRSWGYGAKDIAWSVRTILRSKNQRKQTVQNLHAAQMEEFVEKATRKMKHVFLFPLSNRKKAKQVSASRFRAPSPAKNFEASVLRKTSILQTSAA